MKKLFLLLKYRWLVRAAIGNQIALFDNNNTAQALGGLTDEEISALVSWLPDCGLFVEFGTLFGLTSKMVAAKKPNLKIVAIDNFSWNPFGLLPKLHEEFTRKILANEIASGQIKIVNTTSEEYRAGCRCAPDAVFFDALHQYVPVKNEIDWAKAIGVKCICGHDYGNPNPLFGVTRAVDELFVRVDVKGMCWRGYE